MSVTIKVLDICKSTRVATIEAIDDKTGKKIMKSPVKYKQNSKKSIESCIRKDFKAFDAPVWGGFCVVFYCSVD